jgi:monofunctional biosynthetic peptidoglycan transglycosylase
MAEEKEIILFSSDAGFDPSKWMIVNDGVMGGVSRSSVQLGPKGNLEFSGIVSLENNGGFASVRRMVELPIEKELSGILLRLRGDGKDYQMRLRMGSRFDGIAYRKTFSTNGEWQTVRFLFKEFIPSFRGRQVPGAPPLTPSGIRQIGFLISDYQEGPFHIEVESISLF